MYLSPNLRVLHRQPAMPIICNGAILVPFQRGSGGDSQRAVAQLPDRVMAVCIIPNAFGPVAFDFSQSGVLLLRSVLDKRPAK